jgi:hypothetical protein
MCFSVAFSIYFMLNESNHHLKTTWEYFPKMNTIIINEILPVFFHFLSFSSVANHSAIVFVFSLEIFVPFGHSTVLPTTVTEQ